MADRRDRLRKLVTVQEKLKALHETRRAGHLAAAAAARREAQDIAARLDSGDPMTGLFPDLYSRHIAGAVAREQAELQAAEAEAHRIAVASVRGDVVGRKYREVNAQVERDMADRERLERAARGKLK